MSDTTSLAFSFSGWVSPVNAFMLIITLSFLLCLAVGIRGDSVSEFFTVDRGLSTLRNTLALCGDWIPTSALLGTVSAVAVGGFDGTLLAASFAMAPAILLLLAEPLRSTGSFTLGDVLFQRFPDRRTRIAGAVATIAICIPMTVIQLTMAGDATAYLLGLESDGASQICTVLIGALIITFSAFGGMRGTSMIQIVKTVLVFITLLVLVGVVLRRSEWDLGTILERAGLQSGDAQSYYSPGRLYGDSTAGILDLLSLGMTAFLGPAILPHIVMRVNVFRDERAVHRGSAAAVVVMSVCGGLMAIAGLSTAAMVGTPITSNNQQNTPALFQLSASLDNGTNSDLLLTLVACAVFVAALSTSSGLTLGMGALAHDLYASSKRHTGGEERQIFLARWIILTAGVVSLLLALQLQNWSIVSMTTFVLALGASTMLPSLTYTLFWKGFTRAGLYATIYGSIAFCAVLQFFSKSSSGSPTSLLPERDFHWIPLQHIAIISIPAGFIMGWLFSHLGRPSKARPSAPTPERSEIPAR